MTQVMRAPKSYDICVIGSGAGGGMAAKILTEGGLSVALLEAGPPVNPEKDYKMFVWPYELPHRGVGVGGKAAENFGEFLAPNGAWNIAGEPYTSAPGSNFQWFRSRIVGGRTNHWGRIALRFAPVDFKSKSRDGLGEDWPIAYEDLAPYYDKVESYIGVFGTKENVPSAPDGVFLPPPKPRCSELLIKKACNKLNITCIPSRLAILTKPLNGRPACHYCGQCGRGCTTASNFSSSQVLIPPALQTGRLTLITGAMAREILVGADGKAAGVSYIDKAITHRKAHCSARGCGGGECLRISALATQFQIEALFPMGLPIPRGKWGATSPILWGAAAGDTFRKWKKSRRTITTAPAACTCISPGGNTIAKMIFPAATTSKSAEAGNCPARECSTMFARNSRATAQN